ncbi:DUF2225 domain-containing protein [Methanocella sp. CWC-04]|uniref:DUF2225 domain-containing protein n=1 Tax=Methanooceanicella nereidis TaxID=2052831 RepID=A0AAP2W7N8_9EURY|nr:DUF2225 domain-containing protein [Methanocella sp. CWC-04]MCD1295394.1 DUF2225 domain-containing protein [Methanocella sp. CWC-04]
MTTLQSYRLTCPLCGNMFETELITSTNSFGRFHSDFYREASGKQPICYFVHTCTNCGYTGYDGDFQPQDFSTEFRHLVSENITPEVKDKKINIHGNFYLAALCAEWRGASPQSLGRIYHMGAWCERVRGEKEKEKFFLGKAAEYFEKALDAKEPSKESRAIFVYLIGDIHRRLGNLEKANQWYAKVEQTVKEYGGDDKIVEYAKRQISEPVDIFS